MDIIQLYIQQQFGDEVKPWYSETFHIQSVVVGATSVIEANFIDEKVKLILCSNMWMNYAIDVPVQITDIFNKNVFQTVASAVPIPIGGMFPFPFIQNGSAIKFVANNANFKFSLFFQKVYFYNDKA